MQEAVASHVGQASSAAPGISGKGEGVSGTQHWAVGQSGSQEEGNSLFHPTKQLRFLELISM